MRTLDRRWSGGIARAGLITLALLLLSGCGQPHRLPAQRRPSPVMRMGAGAPAHIAVVVMENEEYGQVIGAAVVPFINRLAAHGGLAVEMYAVTHPSLPNYLALTGGSTFGIDSDCTGCTVRARNLVDQLEAAGVTWRAYMEGLPHACFRGGQADGYAKKHDPFMYYADVAGNPARCRNIVPLSRLAADELAGALPRFIWITPDLCNDMHDCDLATGDRFLSRLLPGLLARLGRRGLLFLTWDEGSSDDGCCRLAAGGHVVTIVAGPGARPGARLTVPTDHYSVLQAIEDLLRLPRLGAARCPCTPSLGALVRAG